MSNATKTTKAATPAGKGIADFEAAHGGPKLKRLERQLEVERAKVEQLAGKHDVRHRIAFRADSVRIGVCGDLHCGSLYHHEDALVTFARLCVDSGCTMLLCAGDILDGWKVYRGQEFELRDVGFDAQIARAAKTIAALPLPFKFITGNHDLSFKSLAGVDVGKTLAAACGSGAEHLGDEQATLDLQIGVARYSVRLVHPGGSGSSYALSYRPQKLVESIQGGDKPDMLIIGHYHKAEFLPSYRNVAVLQSGTFQRQTPFMARQALAAHIGGWIVSIAPGDGANAVTATFASVYR